MKKYLYVFFVLIVFISGIWLLNNFGVVSVQAWGENIITSTPFLKEYVQTNEVYTQVNNELEEIEIDYARLAQESEGIIRDLEEARKTIQQQDEKIEALEANLEQLEEDRYSQEERINRLVKIYGEMDPEEAARILTSLDDELVIQILLKMKEEKTAAILIELPTETAASYSIKLR